MEALKSNVYFFSRYGLESRTLSLVGHIDSLRIRWPLTRITSRLSKVCSPELARKLIKAAVNNMNDYT
jgi:hypothetical protein